MKCDKCRQVIPPDTLAYRAPNGSMRCESCDPARDSVHIYPERTCARCGRRFHGHYATARTYCTEECSGEATRERAASRNEARAAGREAARAGKVCEQCRYPFTPARSDARYCSTKCRVAAHRQANGR